MEGQDIVRGGTDRKIFFLAFALLIYGTVVDRLELLLTVEE